MADKKAAKLRRRENKQARAEEKVERSGPSPAQTAEAVRKAEAESARQAEAGSGQDAPAVDDAAGTGRSS